MNFGGEPPQLIVRVLKIPSVHPPKIPRKILHLSISLCLFISTVPQLIPPPQLRPLHKVSLKCICPLLGSFTTQLPNWESIVFGFPTHQPRLLNTQFLHSQYPPVSSNVACWKLRSTNGKCEKITNLQQTQGSISMFPWKIPWKIPILNQILSNPIKSKSSRTFPWKIPITRNPHQSHYQSYYFLVTELPSGTRLHFANRKITMLIKFGKSTN